MWLGPVLAVVIAALLVWRPFEEAVQQEDVFVAAGPQLVGELELALGGSLRVSLAPLHEDARRQEFDGVALARRLALAEGEPWRLRLVALGAGPAGPLDGVAVVDGEGVCSAPILQGVELAQEGVQDPLVGLFQPRTIVGERPSWELVLWGRAPGPGVRLECSWGSAELAEESEEEERERVVDGELVPLDGAEGS